ncbi:MAG: sugar phosphate isomerase/epimerase [Armatimonadetes bacterium]|nr:sugar phosphate isomerase/epimerase [Armatimonadota bacterium]
MPIRVSIFSDEVSADFKEAVRLSAEAGATGLELRGHMFGKSIAAIDNNDVARIKDLCASYGAQVAVIGSPVGKCDMTDPEECRQHQVLFRRMVELAHAFDTRLIRGFALWHPDGERALEQVRPNLDEHLPRIVAFLQPIIQVAEIEGVRFCLETEGTTMVGTCAEARKVMDALGNLPALGVAWDINNGLSCGESPYPEGYELIRHKVYHVHVKPNAEKSLSTVGDSGLTYEQLLTALRKDGYDGWASIEHWGEPEHMLKGVRELIQVLQRVSLSCAGDQE